jgi:hypothetical protein
LTAFVFAFLLLLLAVIPNVQAGWAHCRSDPIVHLSNGQILSLSAGIGTKLNNVEEIHYTLHLPADVTVEAVVGTPQWPNTLITFTAVQDSAPDEYHTETIVHTSEESVAVSAFIRVMGVGGNITDSTDGFEDETLHLHVPIP